MTLRSTNESKVKKRHSFIEEARRKQILDIAIQTIATQGFRNTSIEHIAAKAGISKGVIYYHFNGKRELVGHIWTALIDELYEYRKVRVDAQCSATEKLGAYVEAQFEFLHANIKKFVALFDAGIDLTSEDGSNPWSATFDERCFKYLAQILSSGQKSGEFGEFSPDNLAPVIQGAIDGIGLQWISYPEGVDLDGCKRELLGIIKVYTTRKI